MEVPNAKLDQVDPIVRVTDDAATMISKIKDYLSVARSQLYPRVAEAARQFEIVKLTRNDRELAAVLYGINIHIREMEAEVLMPRNVIGNDPERRKLRDQIDMTLTRRPHDVAMRATTDMVPYDGLRPLRNAVIDSETFTRLVADNAEFQELVSLNLSVEQLIKDCESLAARRCARRCGTAAPLQRCEVCNRFYCSTSCLYSHLEFKECTPD